MGGAKEWGAKGRTQKSEGTSRETGGGGGPSPSASVALTGPPSFLLRTPVPPVALQVPEPLTRPPLPRSPRRRPHGPGAEVLRRGGAASRVDAERVTVEQPSPPPGAAAPPRDARPVSAVAPSDVLLRRGTPTPAAASTIAPATTVLRGGPVPESASHVRQRRLAPVAGTRTGLRARLVSEEVRVLVGRDPRGAVIREVRPVRGRPKVNVASGRRRQRPPGDTLADARGSLGPSPRRAFLSPLVGPLWVPRGPAARPSRATLLKLSPPPRP